MKELFAQFLEDIKSLSDHMRCFFCGNGFRNWEPADDPWTLHAQWYPECTFVNIKKDAQFIKNARESSQRRTIKPIDEHLLTGLMEGLGFFPALIEHFGFPDVCVRPALRQYLKSTKDLLPFVTEARCIELMLWYMQESTKAEMGLRGIHHEDVEGRVEPANLEWQSAPSDMETVATANEMDVDVVGSMSGFMTTNLGLRALPSPVETEAEETTIVANEMDVETGEEATDFDATSHVETVMNTSTPTSWAADILLVVPSVPVIEVSLAPASLSVAALAEVRSPLSTPPLPAAVLDSSSPLSPSLPPPDSARPPLIWKKIRKVAGKFVPDVSPVLHLRGTLVADPVQVAAELGSHFSSVSSGSHLPQSFLLRKLVLESSPLDFHTHLRLPYNDTFSLSELQSALGLC
ncbi:uncharacterized protein [Procambarus clarkii]|uniref:uncharacterized protein n=1 Tax=Procambarus clarkii TaxID=6728 RepID=UPI00374451FB